MPSAHSPAPFERATDATVAATVDHSMATEAAPAVYSLAALERATDATVAVTEDHSAVVAPLVFAAFERATVTALTATVDRPKVSSKFLN